MALKGSALLPERAIGRLLHAQGNDPTLGRMDGADPSKFVIIDGDKLTVTFATTVIPMAQGPKAVSGSSPDFSVRDSKVCRKGDELPVSLRVPLQYTDGAYTVPGQGTLAVFPVTTTVMKNGGLVLLLKGTQFSATFTVTQPAKTPPPASTPDPVLSKPGTASFTTSNDILSAT